MTLLQWHLLRFDYSDAILDVVKSFANKIPSLFNNYAICVVLPPGAAAISQTFIPGYTFKANTGSKEAAS